MERTRPLPPPFRLARSFSRPFNRRDADHVGARLLFKNFFKETHLSSSACAGNNLSDGKPEHPSGCGAIHRASSVSAICIRALSRQASVRFEFGVMVLQVDERYGAFVFTRHVPWSTPPDRCFRSKSISSAAWKIRISFRICGWRIRCRPAVRSDAVGRRHRSINFRDLGFFAVSSVKRLTRCAQDGARPFEKLPVRQVLPNLADRHRQRLPVEVTRPWSAPVVFSGIKPSEHVKRASARVPCHKTHRFRPPCPFVPPSPCSSPLRS